MLAALRCTHTVLIPFEVPDGLCELSAMMPCITWLFLFLKKLRKLLSDTIGMCNYNYASLCTQGCFCISFCICFAYPFTLFCAQDIFVCHDRCLRFVLHFVKPSKTDTPIPYETCTISVALHVPHWLYSSAPIAVPCVGRRRRRRRRH